MSAQTHPTTIAFKDLPKLNEDLADGTFAGITTNPDGTHYAVVKINAPIQKLNWKAAMAAAEDAGAQLPNKAEAALVTTNCKLDPDWYWTREAYSASGAWYFHSNGSTYVTRKSAAGGALAVRLIQITA